jgi:hypothetical protein
MFFLLLHIVLLFVCSPYFLIVLIWGSYKFLTTESLSSGSSSSKSEVIVDLGDITLSEKKSYFGNLKFNLFGKKTEEEKKRIEETKKIAEENKRIAKEKKAAEIAKKIEEKKIEEKKKNSLFSMFSKKTDTNNASSSKDRDKRVPNFNLFGGEGEQEPSSLQKFMNILSEIDNEKMISLWNKLLFIYVIQSWLLTSPPSFFYNKIMHRS